MKRLGRDATTVRSRPPGPRGRFLLGHLPELEQDRLGFLRDCATTYGDVVFLRFGRRPVYLVAHPEHIDVILVGRQTHFARSYVVRLLRPVLGDGLLTSDGEHWRRQRRLAQPAFHRARLAGYAKTMVACTERMLAGWRGAGEVRDVHAELMGLTLEIVAQTLFGADVRSAAGEVARALDALMQSFIRLRARPWLVLFHTQGLGQRPMRRAIERLDSVVYRIIADRQRGDESGSDLLAGLLDARDEVDGSRLSDREVRDSVMTLFLAGHETTANALTWTWHLLARHPDAQEALWAEVDGVLRGRGPSVEDLPRLPYTERVVREAMRLYPPAHSISREAVCDTEIAGYRVPAGTTVLMSQWVTHRDARYYDHPDAFDPDRWTEDFRSHLPRFAYFPFGGGPRLCIGQGFAMTEAVLLLAAIARQYRLAPVGDEPVTPEAAVTLRPRGGLRMRIERR